MIGRLREQPTARRAFRRPMLELLEVTRAIGRSVTGCSDGIDAAHSAPLRLLRGEGAPPLLRQLVDPAPAAAAVDQLLFTNPACSSRCSAGYSVPRAHRACRRFAL